VKATIERQDGPAGRFYKIGDARYPSVTHILGAIAKPALIAWSANVERAACVEAAADLFADFQKAVVPPVMPREAYLATLTARIGPVKASQKLLVKAGDIGTQAHQLIEWQLRTATGAEAGPKPVVSEAAQWSVFAFEDWWKSVSGKAVLIERVVFSTVHGFAGTLDLLARVNGVLTEVSIKTGKSIYGEAHIQSAAYVTALSEMGYLPPAGGSVIVRLPKVDTDPAFQVVQAEPAADLFPVFLAVKRLWEWTYQQEQAYRARTSTRKAVA
jgi:hypothetical protein